MTNPYRKIAEAARNNGVCPVCGSTTDPQSFKDELSVKEYYISGLCQECQDSVFG